jgi:hypothetical protein
VSAITGVGGSNRAGSNDGGANVAGSLAANTCGSVGAYDVSSGAADDAPAPP